MIIEEIRKALYGMQDAKYRDLQIRLIPGQPPGSVIGVRTPELRALAKRVSIREDSQIFLDALPHEFFDENQLHAFIVSGIGDYSRCIAELERFLPYVDNWATCDQMGPKVFRKHRTELAGRIDGWITSERPFTVRFGIKMLMDHYLDESFDPSWPERVSEIRSQAYYVRMMIAWYFATALAKQYDAALPYLENRRLEAWTHNMTIRKACESFRIGEERKDRLRALRIG